MMNNETIIHTQECKCLSWKPIIAGALIAVGLSFLLNLFSVAIGLTSFTTNNDGVESLVIGGLIATGLGIVASMFGAGWVTGYLAQRHCYKRHIGALYGFLAWCLALIIAIFLSAHIQPYLSLYGHFLSGTSDVAVQAAPAANNVTVSANNVETKSIVISAYILFSLFFLSAFACSFGGHVGMRHICRND